MNCFMHQKFKSNNSNNAIYVGCGSKREQHTALTHQSGQWKRRVKKYGAELFALAFE
jgi:hypothetical protein